MFALLPTADKALDKLGVHTAGVAHHLAARRRRPAACRSTRASPSVMQAEHRPHLRRFTTRAAAARKTTPEKIDAVAQGRVWTGTQAMERGLSTASAATPMR